MPDFICCLRGPLLITAPHSLTLPAVHRKEHLREYGTAQFAISIAQHLQRAEQGASIMLWNCASSSNSHRLDPNCLPMQSLPESEWHRALHRWVLGAADSGAPLLHIDVHGKISDELFLDVGLAACEQMWPRRHQAFIAALKCGLAKECDAALRRHRVLGPRANRITVQTEPKLDGFRSDGFATMAMQTAMLGVPSVQVELPVLLRERLVDDAELCYSLAACFSCVYSETVAPWWLAQFCSIDGTIARLSLNESDAGQPPAHESDDSLAGQAAEEEDDWFSLLGGMAGRCVSDRSVDSDGFSEDQDQEFPDLIPSQAFATTVLESGPVDPAGLAGWLSLLLAYCNDWEQTHGRAVPSI